MAVVQLAGTTENLIDLEPLDEKKVPPTKCQNPDIYQVPGPLMPMQAEPFFEELLDIHVFSDSNQCFSYSTWKCLTGVG